MKTYHVLNAAAAFALVIAVASNNLYWLIVTVVLASTAVVTALDDITRVPDGEYDQDLDPMNRTHLTNPDETKVQP